MRAVRCSVGVKPVRQGVFGVKGVWAKYTPKGKPFGKPAGCIGCHGTRANNDFIIIHEFK